MPGDQHDRAGEFAILGRFGQEFQARDVGQTKIQQQTIEFARPQRRDAGGAVPCRLDLKRSRRLSRQQPAIQPPVGFVVVDAQLPSALARTFEPGSPVTVGVEQTKLLVVPAQTS